MAAQTRAVNKARFENGDKPQGSDYVDLIDSFPSLSDSTSQSLTSDLSIPGLVVTNLSAASANVTGGLRVEGIITVSGGTNFLSQAQGFLFTEVTGNVSASATYVEINVSASTLTALTSAFSVTAASLQYTGSQTKNFWVDTRLTLAASVAATPILMTIGVNNSAQTLYQHGVFASGLSSEHIGAGGIVQLAQNDRVHVMMRSSAATGDGFQIKNLTIAVKE